MSEKTEHYPIGTPGKKWEAEEEAEWLSRQTIKRSYFDDVVKKVELLRTDFDVEQYGELNYEKFGAKTYPLLAVRTRNWTQNKPTVLVTGGVHGYETSGVHGALRFVEKQAEKYSRFFNLVVAPCVSPWGYETINRWNPEAIDPNRSFTRDSKAPESAALMQYVSSLGIELVAHIDLHETTDTDNSEFRPALAARDGVTNSNWNIPDGFYLVGNSERPVEAFQTAILESVSKVTHIAESDENGKLIGVPVAQTGVITYPASEAGLCMGLSDALYVTTTEVYPDSEQATPEQCIEAQVAAVKGGLDYLMTSMN